MKAAPILLSLVVLVPLLAGCAGPGPDPPAPTTDAIDPRCVGRICPANSNALAATYFKEKFGLIQVNMGIDTGVDDLDIDGDLIAWQAIVVGEGGSQIIGFNITTGRLYPIDTERGFHRVDATVSHGRVTYQKATYEKATLRMGSPYPAWWQEGDQPSQSMNLSLGAAGSGHFIEKDWLLVSVVGAYREGDAGIWAVNLSDGRRIQVYSAPTPRSLGADVKEHLIRTVMYDGKAYTAIDTVDTARRIGNASVIEFDLETGAERVVYFQESAQINRFDGAETGLVWEAASVIYLGEPGRSHLKYYNRSLPEAIILPGTGEGHFPAIGGEWVTYKEGRDDVYAYHIPSMTKHLVYQSAANHSVEMTAVSGNWMAMELGMINGETPDWDGDFVYLKDLAPLVPEQEPAPHSQ